MQEAIRCPAILESFDRRTVGEFVSFQTSDTNTMQVIKVIQHKPKCSDVDVRLKLTMPFLYQFCITRNSLMLNDKADIHKIINEFV